jgi:hypothetical protein
MDCFDALMSRFGVWDCTEWSDLAGFWFRNRIYFDGAWLEGHRAEPIIFWGA